MVLMSNVDMRMTTSQFFNRRSWAETQNVLGFDLAKTVLNDEKFDIILTDAGPEGIVAFAKVVRSSRRNAHSLIAFFPPKGRESDADPLSQDKSFVLWDKPLSDELDKTLLNMMDQLRAQTQAAAIPKAPAPKTFDARLLNTVLDAVKDVLSFYFNADTVEFGKPNYRKGPLSERSGITGLITVGGDKFKGSMALAASLDFLQILSQKIYPDQDIKLTKEGAMDMIAELSNQIVGRIKMRFGDLGLKSEIGLPEVMIGKNHKVPHKIEGPALFLGVKINGSICEVELSIVQDDDFTIDETQAVESAKGMLLFD